MEGRPRVPVPGFEIGAGGDQHAEAFRRGAAAHGVRQRRRLFSRGCRHRTPAPLPKIASTTRRAGRSGWSLLSPSGLGRWLRLIVAHRSDRASVSDPGRPGAPSPRRAAGLPTTGRTRSRERAGNSWYPSRAPVGHGPGRSSSWRSARGSRESRRTRSGRIESTDACRELTVRFRLRRGRRRAARVQLSGTSGGQRWR